MMKSISIIVPALNEEGNLSGTLEEIIPLVSKNFSDFEVLIFDDHSSDQTGIIAEEWAKKNNKIKVIHNPKTMGLGYNYKKGVQIATKDYVMMVPGDNEITGDSYQSMFNLLGNEEIIIPCTVNMEIRPFLRRLFSNLFTKTMNLLFGLNLRYYNGTVIHKRQVIQSIEIVTNSFAYQAEILVKLLKKGHSYRQTDMVIKPRTHGGSKAIRLKNILQVLKILVRLFFEIHFKKIQ